LQAIVIGDYKLNLAVRHLELDFEVFGAPKSYTSIAEFILHQVHVVFKTVDLSDIEVSIVTGWRIV